MLEQIHDDVRIELAGNVDPERIAACKFSKITMEFLKTVHEGEDAARANGKILATHITKTRKMLTLISTTGLNLPVLWYHKT